MNKMKEKEIAESFSKVVGGKCSNEDLVRFASLIMENSTLGESIEIQPLYSLEKYEDNDLDGRFKYGEYFMLGDSITLNELLVSFLNQRKEGFLARTVEVIGHETTHYKQFLEKRGTGQKDINNFSEKTIKNMFSFVGQSVADNEASTIYYNQYRILDREIEAREGGRIFSKEILSNLRNNRYIDRELKKYIDKEIKINEKNINVDIENENKERMFVKSFIDSFSKIDLTVAERIALTKSEEEVFWALSGIIDAKRAVYGDLKVCEDYYNCLNGDVDMPNVKEALSKKINEMGFSKELRKKMQKKCVNIIKECDDVRDVDVSFKNILTIDQVVEVSEDIIDKGDINKFGAAFFSDVLLKYGRNGELVNKLGCLLVEKKKDLDFNTNDKENCWAARKLLSRVSCFQDLLDDSIRGEIIEMKEKYDNKVDKFRPLSVKNL